VDKIKKYIFPQSSDDVFGYTLISCGLGIFVNTLFIFVTYYFNLNNDITMLVQTMLSLIILGYMTLVLHYILIKDIKILIKDIKRYLKNVLQRSDE